MHEICDLFNEKSIRVTETEGWVGRGVVWKLKAYAYEKGKI